MRKPLLTATSLTVAWLALATAVATHAASPRQRGGQRDVTKFTMLNEDGFPLNVNPEIVSADEVDLDDGDMIMGIVLSGEARAYPVNYMNGPNNEVVNDTLGGQAIAPSW